MEINSKKFGGNGQSKNMAKSADGKHRYFQPSANELTKLLLVLFVIITVGGSYALTKIFESPYVTRQNIVAPQPVPFSHKHHVGEEGIDCRYCHTTVEKSAFAGIPPTETCINCHSQLYTASSRCSNRCGRVLSRASRYVGRG